MRRYLNFFSWAMGGRGYVSQKVSPTLSWALCEGQHHSSVTVKFQPGLILHFSLSNMTSFFLFNSQWKQLLNFSLLFVPPTSSQIKPPFLIMIHLSLCPHFLMQLLARAVCLLPSVSLPPCLPKPVCSFQWQCAPCPIYAVSGEVGGCLPLNQRMIARRWQGLEERGAGCKEREG